MKVGFVSYHSFIRPGGVQSHILCLRKEFAKRGIDSKIIIPRRHKSERYDKDIIFLGRSIPALFRGTESDFSFASNLGKISRTLKNEKFDILHFHNFGVLSHQILKESNSLNILTIHTGYERDEISEKNVFSQLKFRGRYRVFNGLSFLGVNNLTLDYIKEETKKKMDGVTAASSVAFKFTEEYSGPKTIIPNGIDLEKFNLKAKKIKKFQNPKYLNILFLNRIEERKGLIFLLKAYQILEKKFNNLRLIIVGDGEGRKNCEFFVKENNLKNVFFEGEIPNAETPSYYRTTDIFVSPAPYGESFGIVLLEAMASGAPVAAFANEGYKTVMAGKYKEFLAKPEDFIDLAEKIEILIKSPKKREEMKKIGLKLAKQYSWHKVADKVLDFYQTCQKQKTDKTN